MGKMTEYLDYLYRKPEDLDRRWMLFHYSHGVFGSHEKKIRSELKLYKEK